MITRKYAAKPFLRMDANEIALSVKQLLIKISIITGWKLYDDAMEQRILEQQLMLKLNESYANTNPAEIEYAFRNSFVKDWGKAINLSLIDEVMQQYLSQRAEASRLEEQVMSKPKELTAPPEPVTDEEWIEIGQGLWKSTKNIMLIPPKLYRLLNLKPTEDEKERIKEAADRFISNLIYQDKDYFIGEVDKLSTYNRLLRQIAVAEFFNNNLKQQI